MESMSIHKTISQELTQLSSTVHLLVEVVSNLPFAEDEDRFLQVCKNLSDFSYWIPWTNELGAWVDSNGLKVTIVIRDDILSSQIKELIVGFGSVVIGVCHNLQGKVAVHANAITLDGIGCAFAGYSGMGKSTLTAYCTSLGAGFVTDDVLIINERGLVTPGSPYLKLYPHTGESLGLDVPKSNDYLGQLGVKLHSSALPLSIIYLLAETNEDSIYSEQLPPSQSVFELLTHSYYANKLIEDNPSIFDTYINVVNKVMVKKLFYPRDFRLLPQVYNFLLDEVRLSVCR